MQHTTATRTASLTWGSALPSYGEPETGSFFAQSKKSTTVNTSSTEAEVSAAFNATKHIMFFRDLLAELGYPQLQPTTLWMDNMSLITLATAFSGSTKNVKHFMMLASPLRDREGSCGNHQAGTHSYAQEPFGHIA